MNVALPADAWGIAQPLGDPFDRLDDIFLGLGLRVKGFEFAKRERSEDGPGPRPKILRGEFLTRDLSKVGVDLGRLDRMRLPVFVEVLKQVLSRKVTTFPYDTRQTAVGQVDRMIDAALASEAKPDRCLFDCDV